MKETNELLDEEMTKTKLALDEMASKQLEIKELIDISKESFVTKQEGL